MQTKVSGAINQTNQRLTHCRLIATPLVAATPLVVANQTHSHDGLYVYLNRNGLVTS